MKRTGAVLSIAALAALVIYARLPAGQHYLYVLHKLGHPLVFGLIAWIIQMQRRAAASWLAALVLALLLGGATELAQAVLGRDARWSDVARDGLGAATALALYEWRLRRGLRRGLLAATLCLIVVTPLLWCAAAYANRALRFPVIAEFSTPLDRYFTVTAGARLEWNDAPAGLRVIPDERGSGLGWREPPPDWSDFHTLVVEVSNPNDVSQFLLLRIHDRRHNWRNGDRYNGRFELPAHAQRQLRVPLAEIAATSSGRQLDLRHVAGIALFVPRAATPRPFVISSLRLE